MRLTIYALVSFAATVAVVAHAMIRRGQFYPAVIYLSSSKTSLLVHLSSSPRFTLPQVLGNGIFTLVVIAGKAAKSIFFGSLREVEIEVRRQAPSTLVA